MEELTETSILSVMLTVSFRLVTLCPARLAAMTAEPIALYVVFSDTVWSILSGKSILSEYNENKTPVSKLVISSNALAGIDIILAPDR